MAAVECSEKENNSELEAVMFDFYKSKRGFLYKFITLPYVQLKNI